MGEVGEVDDFEALLHDVVAVDVLDEVEREGVDEGHELLLQEGALFGELDGLLHHPAPVAVLRERQDVGLDHLEQPRAVLLLPAFEDLLEDVVPELVLRQLDALLDQRLEHEVLRVRLALLDDRLHCPRAVLVARPPRRLVQVVQDVVGAGLRVVLRGRHVDCAVAVVLLGLETQSA